MGCFVGKVLRFVNRNRLENYRFGFDNQYGRRGHKYQYRTQYIFSLSGMHSNAPELLEYINQTTLAFCRIF